MNSPKISLLIAAVLCTWTTLPGRTEEGTDKEQKPPKPGYFGGEGGSRDKMRMRFMENLSPENRKRFEAAREKAMQDPELQELRKEADRANRDFFKAVRDKMMEIDPGLADIVKNNVTPPPGKGPKKEGALQPPESMAPDGGKPEGKGWRKGGGGPLPGLAGLTDSEREQYLAAREKAKEDPTVQAAEKKKQNAESPEARQAAADEYRKAMTAAILKADPSLAPLVEKMTPPAPPKANPKDGAKDAPMASEMQME